MEVARRIAEVRSSVARARAAGRQIAFVPTMGALHAGHLSLIHAARSGGAGQGGAPPFVVVSIFVNPTQFGPGEDLARYPRDEPGDLSKCRAAGADLVFLPAVEEMYPREPLTTVHVARLTDTLCGPVRPGHFDGVATVVAKLFHIVQPDRAFFGQKDYQQLQVVRRMVADLDMPIEIVACPTVREPDGLAMSSRNAYLAPDERARAPVLYQALRAAAERIRAGERDAAGLIAGVRRQIEAGGVRCIDYVSVVDAETLRPVERIESAVVVAAAVRIGSTRLIDNVPVDPPRRDR